MINKNFIIVSILLILCCSISFAQVRIEVVPPFIEGGSSPSWNENRNSPNSISEDVFELKNGSTIRGNLESFSGGVYFVNIGGITKSIPENSILKVNGQFLSSVKATVPDGMTAEVKVVKLDYNSLDLLFNKLRHYEQNSNRAIIKNNKLILDDNKYVGFYSIKGNEDFVIKQTNGAWFSLYGGPSAIIEKCSNRVFGTDLFIPLKFFVPLKVEDDGVYCLASDLKKDKNTNVYFYRYGAKNLEGPVAKCDCSFGGAEIWGYYAAIDKLGLAEIALFSGRRRYADWSSLNELTFYKSTQMGNGLFAFKPKYTYKFRNSSDNENTNEYTYSSRLFGSSSTLYSIGYGHFFNKTSNNWIVVYHNLRTHKITQKKDSELYIDIFDEDVSKGVIKSLNFICPSISSSPHLMVDIDRDGITELVFKGDSDDESTKKAAIIVKLKGSESNLSSKKIPVTNQINKNDFIKNRNECSVPISHNEANRLQKREDPSNINNYNKLTNSAIFITDENNVRSSPDAKSSLVAVPSKGTKCEILEQKDRWYKVKFGSTISWTNRINLKIQ